MNRRVRVFRSYKEQEKDEISYQVNLSSDERQRIAKALKKRVFGVRNPDVREGHNKQ